jgi:hypothetical protein
MKHISKVSALVFASIMFIFLFCGVTCDNEPDDSTLGVPEKCGPKKFDDIQWSSLVFSNLFPAEHFIATEEGLTYYSYSVPGSYDNVCPHEHVSGAFKVMMLPEVADKVVMNAEIAYGILHTYPITEWDFSFEDPHYVRYREFNFGISHLYGEDPGWFFPTLTIAIEYQGDLQLTHDYFEQNVFSIEIKSAWYEYKAP